MKKTNVIIIILMLLVLGLSGYIVYDKVLSNNGDNTNYQNNNNQNDENDNDSLSTICTVENYDDKLIQALHV